VIGKPGDRIAVDTPKVGQHQRVGVIKRVEKHEGVVAYEVRWDDGATSVLRPSAGSVRILPKPEAKIGAKSQTPAKAGAKPKTRKI